MEPAGTKLPLAPPPSHGKSLDTCGTNASAWVQEGEDPKLGEGEKDITICFAWNKECQWPKQTKTVACKGKGGTVYYLYYLTPAGGNCAYCAIRE